MSNTCQDAEPVVTEIYTQMSRQIVILEIHATLNGDGYIHGVTSNVVEYKRLSF